MWLVHFFFVCLFPGEMKKSLLAVFDPLSILFSGDQFGTGSELKCSLKLKFFTALKLLPAAPPHVVWYRLDIRGDWHIKVKPFSSWSSLKHAPALDSCRGEVGIPGLPQPLLWASCASAFCWLPVLTNSSPALHCPPCSILGRWKLKNCWMENFLL